MRFISLLRNSEDLSLLRNSEIRVERPLPHGEVPEWLKGADCKSAGYGLRGFESLSHHQFFQRNCCCRDSRAEVRASLHGKFNVQNG